MRIQRTRPKSKAKSSPSKSRVGSRVVKGRPHRRRLSPAQRVARLHQTKNLPIILRGRAFGLRELRVILQTVSAHWKEGRTRISIIVCERLGWRQPNGWLKDRACRDVLRRLARRGLVKLPKKLSKNGGRNGEWKAPQGEIDQLNEQPHLDKLPSTLTLELAKGNAAEKLWNYLVAHHHYLGYRVAVGRCLKYLVRGDGRVLGAIAFSSPVWRLEARDRILVKCGLRLAELHDRVINNTRFVLLPQARIEHLASKVLAAAVHQVAADWEEYYAVQPLVAETFVQPSKFDGTCYKAANWLHIGQSRGFAKVGPTHHNSQEPKAVFIYGLNRSTRSKLAKAVPQQKGRK